MTALQRYTLWVFFLCVCVFLNAYKAINNWIVHCWSFRTGFKPALVLWFSTSLTNSRFQMGMSRLGRRGWFRAQTACRLDDGDSPCGVTTFKNDLCRLGDAQDSQQTAVHGCGVKQPTDRSRSRISDTFSSKVTNFFGVCCLRVSRRMSLFSPLLLSCSVVKANRWVVLK